MENMFGDIQKQMKETQERWSEIDKLAEELEQYIHDSEESEMANTTANLMLLLVRQLKPMNVLDGEEFESGMKQILDAFGRRANNGK